MTLTLDAGVTGSTGLRASAAPPATQSSAFAPATSLTAKPTQKSGHAWSDPVAQLMARQHVQLTSEPILGPAALLQRQEQQDSQSSGSTHSSAARQRVHLTSEPVLSPTAPMQRQGHDSISEPVSAAGVQLPRQDPARGSESEKPNGAGQRTVLTSEPILGPAKPQHRRAQLDVVTDSQAAGSDSGSLSMAEKAQQTSASHYTTTEAMLANTNSGLGLYSHPAEAMPADHCCWRAAPASACRPVSPPFLFEAAAAEDSLVDFGSKPADAVDQHGICSGAAAAAAAGAVVTSAHESSAQSQPESPQQPSRMQLQSAHSAASQHGDLEQAQQLSRPQQEAVPLQHQQVTPQQAAAVDLSAAASTPASRLPRLGSEAQSIPESAQPAKPNANADADGPGGMSNCLTGRDHGHESVNAARAARASAQGGATTKPDVNAVSTSDGLKSKLTGSKENAPLGMARAVRTALQSHAGSSAPATQAVSKPPKPISNSKV